MQNNLEVIYLHHSGFAVKTENYLLIFDYYRDPSNSLPRLLEEEKTTCVFSSHSHADHFNPIIGKWQDKVTAYFLSDDIREAGGLRGVGQDKLVYMKPYDEQKQQSISVATYGSTDAGVSFLVDVDGWRIFHAGDFNWWHWKEDTPENIVAAKEGFEKELNLMAGLKMDIAFFPVDSRLEEYWAIGAEAFCRRVDVSQLITMHSCGKLWQPPKDFPGNGKQVTVWCPEKNGQTLQVPKKRES